MKRAVIYYSLSGNTKQAAEYVANELGAELYQIEMVKPLPDSKGKQIMIGGMQSSFGLTPKIKGVPEKLSSYDEIILGTPIWAGKAASPVNTLIKKYGAADKITAVFTFSGGGDNDKCVSALKKVLPNMKTQVALADKTNQLSSENNAKLHEFVKKVKA